MGVPVAFALTIFHRHPRIAPRVETAEEGCYAREPEILHRERRTGARLLGRSRTYRDEQLVGRQLPHPCVDIQLGNVDRTFSVLEIERCLGSHVDEKDVS